MGSTSGGVRSGSFSQDPYEIGDFSFQVRVGAYPVTINSVHVMRTVCVHCQQQITDEACYALGFPLNGLLHRACRPYMRYGAVWPHPLTLEEYVSRALYGGGATSTYAGIALRTSLNGYNECP